MWQERQSEPTKHNKYSKIEGEVPRRSHTVLAFVIQSHSGLVIVQKLKVNFQLYEINEIKCQLSQGAKSQSYSTPCDVPHFFKNNFIDLCNSVQNNT